MNSSFVPVGTQNRRTRQTGESFPAVLVLILLISIWFLSNFTIFICAIVLVLGAKLITDTCEERKNVIGTSSQQLRAHAVEHDYSERISVAVKEPQHEPVQNIVSTDPNNHIRLLSERDEEQINNWIVDETVYGVSITSNDDRVAHTSDAMRPAADLSMSPLSASDTPPFITENPMKIAISYSGKNRKRVLKITRLLQNHMNRLNSSDSVFIDQDYQHEICQINGHKYIHTMNPPIAQANGEPLSTGSLRTPNMKT
ncbi:unnamed protein product [Adineta ricciae]|uniref:Uncharacterized protein n=1 Tax=Adineta ricciae TaxID=249248 RepID=A0A815V6D0_ADIRI